MVRIPIDGGLKPCYQCDVVLKRKEAPIMASSDHLDKIEALLARVGELESRAALGELVSDYCRSFDAGDWPLFMSVWHDDAIWEPGAAAPLVQGVDNIQAAAKGMRAASWRESHHMTSNLKLAFGDPDHAPNRADGTSNLDCMGVTPEGTVFVVRGTYHDVFERRDGIWKIAKRGMELHLFKPLLDTP